MAFCPKCGSRLPEGSAFCGSCGARVAQPQTQTQTQFQSQPQRQTIDPAKSAAPTFTPPAAAPTFTPPAAAPNFTPPAAAPTFTPPTAPTFTPPRNYNSGPVCYYHKDEPAVAQCARCGKYICQDCFDSYGVTDEQYAGRALCYDCTKELVAENVTTLKSNKRKILTTFIFTLVGMVIGGIAGGELGAESGSTALGIVLGAMIGGCFWTFIKCWFARIGGAIKGGGFNLISFLIGLILGFVIESIISIYRTIRKVIECLIYLKRTSGFIESDSAALRQMTEYMEYTVVRNQNRGVDIDTLLKENSQLANNSVAQMARTQSEDQIEAHMRGCLATINENGEIIRNFAA